MKLRTRPEDFLVDELASPAAEGGDFAVYRLTKRSLGTLDAVAAVVREWKLAGDAVSFGGLKDRHAVTTQHVTIHRGPRRNLTLEGVHLVYLGQRREPFTSADIAANRFRIVVRDLLPRECGLLTAAFEQAGRDGIPNYFDDQRFGSLGRSKEFTAAAWCRGDYERALWLALADDNPHDRALDRREKRFLRDHWGDWRTCRAARMAEPRRRPIAHLAVRPNDLRGAFVRIDPVERRFMIDGYQSFLWNELLSAWFDRLLPPGGKTFVRAGPGRVCMARSLTDAERANLRSLRIPLPSSRGPHPTGELLELTNRVLARHHTALEALRIHHPRDSFFAKGDRPAIAECSELGHQVSPDELHPGRRQMKLSFQLPRGAYATILVKSIGCIAKLLDE
jgi:tRNA pseudouridine13 synthase